MITKHNDNKEKDKMAFKKDPSIDELRLKREVVVTFLLQINLPLFQDHHFCKRQEDEGEPFISEDKYSRTIICYIIDYGFEDDEFVRRRYRKQYRFGKSHRKTGLKTLSLLNKFKLYK
ncbi:hypothetical protein G9A89_005296 [Geosiphon pyriformis]|nr:hypothetical protein G9A89_005296 [Geosiphon pyriformis]